jgi:hypothetical protein
VLALVAKGSLLHPGGPGPRLRRPSTCCRNY